MVDFGSDLRKRTLVLCAALALAIALSVLLRGRKHPESRVFAAFAGDVGLWYLAQALYGFFQAGIWARFTALLAVLLPLFAIRLFEVIAPPPSPRASPLRRTATLLAIGVTVLVLSPSYGQGWARGIVFGYDFGLFAAALWSFAKRGRESPSRAVRGRAQYLVFTGALALTFSMADFLWFVGAELPPVGVVLSVIFLFAIAQSVGEERLLDLYDLLARLVVATALAFAVAGIFYVCVTVIGRFSTMYLNAVLGAIVVLVLFEPLRQKVDQKIHQVLFRDRFVLETTVREARQLLAYVLEPDEAARVVVSALGTSRRATAVSLYVRDAQRGVLVLASSSGAQPPAELEVAALGPLLDALARGPVSLDALSSAADGAGQGDAERLLSSARVLGPPQGAVVVPIRTEAPEPMGLLVVVDDRARDPFSADDVALLEGLAAQLGVVLQNSRGYAELKRRDRLAALGQMAAGLAHEIKNPLGSIKGAAQLLAEPGPGGAVDPASREFVGIILEEVDRLDRVVRSVLDYARPTGAAPTPVDVNAVVQRTLRVLSAELSDVELLLALDEELPLARIDAEKLRQVLMNLLQNARQAMSGRGTVTISTRRQARGEAEFVVMSVADTGSGMSAGVLQNLFVPFFTTRAAGTGLGLAISQRILQDAGGAIEVKTREGEGTTFLVLVPVAGEAVESPLPPRIAAVSDGTRG
ncbi:MAG: GAF domain-containing protein [Polyangiaceae bacterium]|nr:GAF domain-containing protein [Polyangiaceae bacterium]